MINTILNTAILTTLAIGFILPLAGFIAYAHDRIMANRKPKAIAPQQTTEPVTDYKLSFTPSVEPQVAKVLDNTPIRELKAVAKSLSLTEVTKQMFGKRYSLCNAGQLREAIAYALAQ